MSTVVLPLSLQEEREKREEEELIQEMKERVARKMATMEEASDDPQAHTDTSHP